MIDASSIALAIPSSCGLLIRVRRIATWLPISSRYDPSQATSFDRLLLRQASSPARQALRFSWGPLAAALTLALIAIAAACCARPCNQSDAGLHRLCPRARLWRAAHPAALCAAQRPAADAHGDRRTSTFSWAARSGRADLRLSRHQQHALHRGRQPRPAADPGVTIVFAVLFIVLISNRSRL